jgi:hypothetical protein
MGDVRTIKITAEMRAEALRKVYDATPRVLRLEPGHLRWIERVDEARTSALEGDARRQAS